MNKGCLLPLVGFSLFALYAIVFYRGDDYDSSRQELGKELAKDFATGEIILMAACMAKEGGIPRDKAGDYIAAAVAKQGITRAELFDKWDSKYWPLAKDAEKRNRTSCLN